MPNKRQKSFQNFVKVLEGKRRACRLLQAVALKKCRQRTVWQVAELYISALTTSLRSRQPSLSIHCIENHNQERTFYNVRYLK